MTRYDKQERSSPASHPLTPQGWASADRMRRLVVVVLSIVAGVFPVWYGCRKEERESGTRAADSAVNSEEAPTIGERQPSSEAGGRDSGAAQGESASVGIVSEGGDTSLTSPTEQRTVVEPAGRAAPPARRKPSPPRPAYDQKALEALCEQAGLPAPPDLASLPVSLAAVLHEAITGAGKQRTGEAMGRLGCLYHALATTREESDRAVVCYEAAHAADPNSHKWPYYLGRLFLDRQSLERARMELETSLTLDPSYARCHAWLGNIALQQEAADDAKAHYERYVELVPDDAHGYVGIAAAELLYKNAGDALKMLQKALELEPTNFWAHQVLGNYYDQQGDRDRGDWHRGYSGNFPVLTNVLQRDPLEVELWKTLGATHAAVSRVKLFAATGDMPSALLLADALIAEHPQSTQLLTDVAHFNLEQGRIEQAVNLVKRAMQNDAEFAPAAVVLSTCLLEQAKAAEALTESERAINIDGGLASAHAARGRALERLKRPDDAAEAFATASELEPDSVDHLTAIAGIRRSQGKMPDAREYYLGAMKLAEPVGGPVLEHVFRSYADVLIEMGQGAEAVANCRRLIAKFPQERNYLIMLGQLLARTGSVDEALKHLEAIREIMPRHPLVHFFIGTILQKQNRTAEAKASLEQCLELQPMFEQGYAALADLLLKEKDYAAFVRLMRRGLERLPESALLANTLAWVLATSPNAAFRSPEEAVSLAETACRLTDNAMARALDTLACAYASAGRFDEAVRSEAAAIEAAASQDGSLPVADFKARLELFKRQQPYYDNE